MSESKQEPAKAEKPETVSSNGNIEKLKKQNIQNSFSIPDPQIFGSVTKTRALYCGKWLRFVETTYLDAKGKKREWETIQRSTRVGEIDAVTIVPILDTPEGPKTFLTLQLRPSLEAPCVEFPAGLVDKGETPGQAALRELKEETGLTGEILFESERTAPEPGFASQLEKLVMIQVDPKSVENAVQELEETEHIHVISVLLSEIPKVIEECRKKGYEVDQRLGCFGMGFAMAHALQGRRGASAGASEAGTGTLSCVLIFLAILFVAGAVVLRDFFDFSLHQNGMGR